MSVFEIYFKLYEFNRSRTLGLLDQIEKLPDPAAVLGWRPGPGRAHIAWQLMHIGITESLMATERMQETPAPWPDLVPRFKGGSTPDDDIPTIAQIRQVLSEGREQLLTTLKQFGPEDLARILPWFVQRGWTIERILEVLAWHEGHHQGQAHITLNLWKGAHPQP